MRHKPRVKLIQCSVANLKGSGLAKTEYDFSDNQPWVRTDRNLTFLDETPELNSLYDRDFIDVVAYGPEKAPQQTQQRVQIQPEFVSTSISIVNNVAQQTSPSNQLVPTVATPASSAPTHSPVNFFGTHDSRFHEHAAPEKRRRLTASGYVTYNDSFHGSVSSGSPGQMNQSSVVTRFTQSCLC
jgi:hypothetical protein